MTRLEGVEEINEKNSCWVFTAKNISKIVDEFYSHKQFKVAPRQLFQLRNDLKRHTVRIRT